MKSRYKNTILQYISLVFELAFSLTMNTSICVAIFSYIMTRIIHATNIFAGNEIELGSHTFFIDFGPLEDRYYPLTVVDELASKNARTLVELLRPMFSTGISPLPRLDPYRSKNLSTLVLDEYELPFVMGRVNIRNLVIVGAKAFHLNLLEIRMKNLRTDFEFTIPVLTATVTFDGNLQVAGLPLDTKGKIKLILTNLSIKGAVQARERELQRKYIYSLQALHAKVHINDIKIQLLNTNLSDSIIEMLSSSNSYALTLPNLDSIKEKVKDYITREILKQGNKLLKGLTVDQVKAYLLAEFS